MKKAFLILTVLTITASFDLSSKTIGSGPAWVGYIVFEQASAITYNLTRYALLKYQKKAQELHSQTQPHLKKIDALYRKLTLDEQKMVCKPFVELNRELSDIPEKNKKLTRLNAQLIESRIRQLRACIKTFSTHTVQHKELKKECLKVCKLWKKSLRLRHFFL